MGDCWHTDPCPTQTLPARHVGCLRPPSAGARDRTQWSADYGRSRKRQKMAPNGSGQRAHAATRPNTWASTPGTASGIRRLQEADLSRFTPYQVPPYACLMADRPGRRSERVRHRLGHGDLTTTTRYVKILDEEDVAAADVISELLKAVV